MQYIYLADRDEMQKHEACVPLTGVTRYKTHYVSKCGRAYGVGGMSFYLYMLPDSEPWPLYPEDLKSLDAAVMKHHGLHRTNPESNEHSNWIHRVMRRDTTSA